MSCLRQRQQPAERTSGFQYCGQQVPHRDLDQLPVSSRLHPVHRDPRAIRESTRKRSEKEEDMEIKPIRTKADYRAALREIESLMAADRDTPDGERLDVLVTLVEVYEGKHYPLDLPSIQIR
jgi:hypothetical protein